MLLTGYEDSGAAYQALAQGAAGYVSKASDHTELCESIVTAGRGETVIAPQFAAGIATEIQLRETSDRPALTDREGEVLQAARRGPHRGSGSARSCTSPRRRSRPTSHNLYEKLERLRSGRRGRDRHALGPARVSAPERERPDRDEPDATEESPLQVIGQLAGGIAHDFNNILGVIINYARFAAGSVPPGLPGARRHRGDPPRRRARRRPRPPADDPRPARERRRASSSTSTS